MHRLLTKFLIHLIGFQNPDRRETVQTKDKERQEKTGTEPISYDRICLLKNTRMALKFYFTQKYPSPLIWHVIADYCFITKKEILYEVNINLLLKKGS